MAETILYQESKKSFMPNVGLGFRLWSGDYKGMEATWLRWQDEQGNLLLTSEERAKRLAAQLRALGIEPA